MSETTEFRGVRLGDKPGVVVPKGAFHFAAAFCDHAHIYGQCQGLIVAGGALTKIHEPDPARRAAFLKAFPDAQVVQDYREILDDRSIQLVALAAIPRLRAGYAVRAMEAGKHVLVDKPAITTLDDLALVREAVARTGRKFMVYFSERLHNESAMFATDLVAKGAIGRVCQVIGLGPHRVGTGRAPWFYDRKEYGGILCDIGSHQFEQFLTYTDAITATVEHAAVSNFKYPEYPHFEDFGEANLLGDNGARSYVRIDWLTPKGLSTWGDGRTVILGEKGYIELRKYVDVARGEPGDQVYLVDDQGEHHVAVNGRVGFRYFGELIRDCLEGTSHAMSQDHVFRATELSIRAQMQAMLKVGG